MSFSNRPGSLDSAIATWLEKSKPGTLREKAGRLTETYRHGRSSSHIDLSAYLTARMPATYAAIGRVLAQVSAISGTFVPRSVLDVGAGPGTASWAALQQWPEVGHVTMIETDARFVALATELAAASDISALIAANIIKAKLGEDASKADLVIAAYIFAELAEREAGEMALKLWAQAEQMLVIIEPGTPKGFARIRIARAALLSAGALIVGPCTHAGACPMFGKDWCHFTQRLARSREHMHAKAADVPFEDESFSWLAVARKDVELPQARIIAPPTTTKICTTLKLCSANGLTVSTIASRDKAAYKRAKKLEWGDSI